MIDMVFSTLAGLVAGGGVTWIFMLRENKTIGKADAISKLLDNIKQQQDMFNDMMEAKNGFISQQESLMNGYRATIEENGQFVKDAKYRIAENERKIAGIQKALRKADYNVCFNADCPDRRPPMGTHISETCMQP